MKIITMDPSKCIGCRNCELACAFEKSLLTCKREESNVKVNHYIEEHVLVPMTCLHCEDAWCMKVCPASAIHRDEETGAVVIDSDRCAGCKMCILACPYGNMHFDAEKQVSRKCDLCSGNPRCVGHCVAGALNYEEIEEYADRTRSKVDLRLAQVLKTDCE